MSDPKKVEEYLREVDYSEDPNYVPSEFAIEFVNFIKLVNGAEGEEHKTPIIHYKMLDTIDGGDKQIANMIHRGAAKALALDEQVITSQGNVTIKDLKVGDTIFDRNGKATIITHKSEVFNKPMYKITLVDGRTIRVSEDHLNIVLKKTSNGVFKEYVHTTKEILDKGVHYKRKVDYYNPTGKEAKWFIPTQSAIEFNTKDIPLDAYTVGVILGDGNISKDTGFTRVHTHIDDLSHYQQCIPYELSCIKSDKRNPATYRFSILGISKDVKSFIGTENTYLKRVPQKLLWGSIEQRLAVLRGLMDTDGTVGQKKSSTTFCSVSEGLANDVLWLVRSLGGEAFVSKSYNDIVYYRVHIRMDVCPFSLPRKVQLWYPNLKGKTAIESIERIDDCPSQCIAVSSETHSFITSNQVVTHNTTLLGEYLILYLAVFGRLPKFGKVDLCIYVSDSIDNGVKSMRKNLEYRIENSEFLKKYIPTPKFTDIRWEFNNIDGNKFVVKAYGGKTGIRGTKEMGKRPQLVIMDDLVSDDDARSATVLDAIKSTVHKAIDYALHPQRYKKIWLGTPFNTNDPLYEVVESGTWAVNVFPVCEKFPCTKEEFRGSWEDRFTYEYVKEKYEGALSIGKVDTFYQELMLQIMSDDDRLVLDSDLQWYNLTNLIEKRSNFNFYITTDFATSEKESADFSFISVWAVNHQGNYFWVDGVCKRQTMDKNLDDLFRLVSKYHPQSVGIEVSGQQGGFISWIQREMFDRNIFFTLASNSKDGQPGLRPNNSKVERFNVVVPDFKLKRFYFPSDKRNSEALKELILELSLASMGGFKSKHDDAIDTVSQLAMMQIWLPSEGTTFVKDGSGIWDSDEVKSSSLLSSYIV